MYYCFFCFLLFFYISLTLSSSFLTSSRRLLQCASPAGSGAGESSSSLPPSPQDSSTVPSPGAVSNGPELLSWTSDGDSESGSRRPAVTVRPVPSPPALQDASSQDTQSSGVYSEFVCSCYVPYCSLLIMH